MLNALHQYGIVMWCYPTISWFSLQYWLPSHCLTSVHWGDVVKNFCQGDDTFFDKVKSAVSKLKTHCKMDDRLPHASVHQTRTSDIVTKKCNGNTLLSGCKLHIISDHLIILDCIHEHGTWCKPLDLLALLRAHPLYCSKFMQLRVLAVAVNCWDLEDPLTLTLINFGRGVALRNMHCLTSLQIGKN